jgi:hypothetical protein
MACAHFILCADCDSESRQAKTPRPQYPNSLVEPPEPEKPEEQLLLRQVGWRQCFASDQ